MSDKLLSQAEIEALMSSLAAEPEEPAAATAPDAHRHAVPSRPVKLYDFRRPDKFSKEHLRALRIIHESFARSLASALASYLRSTIQIRLTMVEQATYDEYIRSLPTPTVMYVIAPHPLPGSAVIEMNLPVGRVILDRLLGGSGSPQSATAEMTEIEMALLKTVGGLLVSHLRDAWSNVTALEPTLQEPTLSPEFVQVTLPTETTVMLVFEISLFGTTGTLSLCIPHPVLQPVMESLTSQVWSAGAPGAEAQEPALTRPERLNPVALPITVELGTVELSVRELLGLTEGQIIKLDTPSNGNLAVRVGQHVKFNARPGLAGRNLAVQIVGTRG
ncbi:MAG TPA: flagellar motor switch protein FliM [Chloroflexota bacterium]|nr:flagellar motor switch protein FliM [Chloroflexota bacterium]